MQSVLVSGCVCVYQNLAICLPQIVVMEISLKIYSGNDESSQSVGGEVCPFPCC